MKNINNLILILFSGLWFSVSALGLGNDVGVGARALSFAGNHTAVVNDISATYWNPAALAFLPVREFQITLDGSRTYGESDVWGQNITGVKMSDYDNRIRLGSIGFMSAIPTVQGGLTLAAAYENPYTFDDFLIYNNSTTKEENFAEGGLNNWSASFGVQVAKGLSAGATISLITGTERATFLCEGICWYDEDEDMYYFGADTSKQDWKYMGFGLRTGLLYIPMENLKLGAQISTPQNIRFKTKKTVDGRLYRALSGAFGAGVKLPWMTVALDGRFTMPYTFTLSSDERIPASSQAKYFKLGGGLGLEVPLSMVPVVLRGGYSYDEYDLFSRVLKYDDVPINWEHGGYSVDKNRHTITAGVGIFTSGTGLEFSYGYQTWALAYEQDNYKEKHNYSAHRAAVAFIVRY